MEVKFEKLDKLRAELEKDRAKLAKMQEQIKQKEMKLKEAEATQIVTDVQAMNMSPEQLAQFLALVAEGKLDAMLRGQVATTFNTPKKEDNEDEVE